MTSAGAPKPPPPATGSRHSTGVVIGAAVAGLAVGALAVFAITGVTWKIRVELPAPPYPAPLTSTPLSGYLPPAPAPASSAATSAPASEPVSTTNSTSAPPLLPPLPPRP